MADLDRYYRQLGRRLYELRRERGWTKEDFRRMGINLKSWERHERGGSGMALKTLLKICKKSGLKGAELLRGTDKGIYQKLPAPLKHKRHRVSSKKNQNTDGPQ